MILFPAIDLAGGQCVRLRQGAFDAATIYSSDPIATAQAFAAQGATWLHLVDLDGAKDPALRQRDLITAIIRATPASVQIGGGLRCAADIEALLSCGARRVVIGSVAAEEPSLVAGWIKEFGAEKIVIALDVMLDAQGTAQVKTRGWQKESGQTLDSLLRFYQDAGLGTLLCTDIARDGMMVGPNLSLYQDTQRAFPGLEILASGGIGSLADLQALREAELYGAIMGRALYEQKFTLAEAIRTTQNAG